MSSILKALKKLEDEKAAKQGQRVDITKDIFGASRQPSAAPRWPLITAGGIGFLVIAAGAFYFMSRPSGQATSATPMISPTEPQAITIQRVEVPPVPTEPPPGTRATVSDVDQAASRPKPAQPATRLIPAARQPVATASTKPAVKTASIPTQGKAAVRTARPVPQHSTDIPAISTNRPTITAPRLIPQTGNAASAVAAPDGAVIAPKVAVSGIAYNTVPADRLAMINGAPVGEGKSVSGVKVEEIMPDRVRFSYGARKFEVLVGRSNQ